MTSFGHGKGWQTAYVGRFDFMDFVSHVVSAIAICYENCKC